MIWKVKFYVTEYSTRLNGAIQWNKTTHSISQSLVKQFHECKVICLSQLTTLNMLEILDIVRLTVNIFACKTSPTNKQFAD